MLRTDRFRCTTQYNSLSALLAADAVAVPYSANKHSALSTSAVSTLLLLVTSLPLAGSARHLISYCGLHQWCEAWRDRARPLPRRFRMQGVLSKPLHFLDVHRKRRTRPCPRSVPVWTLSRRRTKPSSLGNRRLSFMPLRVLVHSMEDVVLVASFLPSRRVTTTFENSKKRHDGHHSTRCRCMHVIYHEHKCLYPPHPDSLL